jgi:hypothetical protein
VSIEYLYWSEQPIEFSREDHPITVPRSGNAPLVLKAQIEGYNIDKQNRLLPPVVATHLASTIRFAIESMRFSTKSTRINRRKQRRFRMAWLSGDFGRPTRFYLACILGYLSRQLGMACSRSPHALGYLGRQLGSNATD